MGVLPRRPHNSGPLLPGDRRFYDGGVLLGGAAAYADACNNLTIQGERHSATHCAVPPAADRIERIKRLAGLDEREEGCCSHPDKRGGVGFTFGDLRREGWRARHALMEDDVAVDIGDANSDRNLGLCSLRLDVR